MGLPGRPVTFGDKVMFIPPRGTVDPVARDAWIIEAITGEGDGAIANLRNT